MKNYGASPALLAKVLKQSETNIQAIWPYLRASMEQWDLSSRTSAIAVYATIAVENSSWMPVKEYGNKAYFEKTYGNDLGPYQADGKPLWCGRGLTQLTWSSNYKAYSEAAKVPAGKQAFSKPDNLLLPDVSADALCWFFVQNKVYKAAAKQDWRLVRRIVNGGYNGLAHFLAYTSALDKSLARPG